MRLASRDILQYCIDVGGSITGEHGVGLEKRDMMPLLFTEEDLDIMIGLRNAFNGDDHAESQQDVAHAAHVPRDRRSLKQSCSGSGGHVSSVGASLTLGRELREICAVEHVVEDQVELQAKRIAGCVPGLAVEPASAEEVAAILRLANERKLSVVPAGGLTHQQAGDAPQSIDILLLTSRAARSLSTTIPET